ncbi:DUF6338 family protein [Streptomyces sp. NBC_00338]|uniref:DUF6338 family protein n=1 Tax=Streptomyces sp. NBC_00338 TaxID=2975715 RepID=UPI002259E945|nr:DUF6338 family protein [Streptomyces sp. NBC_00338]MCX5144053.1 DUF6338 family protein [Streptomyces sp. NBC_00338]
MGQSPSTVLQVMLLVLVVLPGVTYQFLRERLRGPVPGERDLGERVLRAVAASVVLDTLYLVAAGPQLVRFARYSGAGGWEAVARQPRPAGLLGLALFVVVPAAAAGGVTWWQRRLRPARYGSTPTAWDHLFRDAGPCFVRMRMRDGAWVGGWYGNNSYATSYPQPPEIHLESAWLMRADGSFVRPVRDSAGLHIRAADTDVLELLHRPAAAPPPGTTTTAVPAVRSGEEPT